MLLGFLLFAAASFGQAPPVADLELIDQYGVRDSLEAHRDHVVVVMVVTAKRLRNLKAWEKALRERYEGLEFVRIADIPEDPPVSYEQVARKLRARVPEDVPILIDTGRRWAGELELDTGRPNLLIIDRKGKVTASFRGRQNAELFGDVCAAIDRAEGEP